MILDLIFVIMTGYFGYSAWRQLHLNGDFCESMHCDPNAWRWWDQLLFKFHKRPVSFQTLEALSWVIVLNILYFMLMPTGIERAIFILMVLAMSTSGYIRQAPMYPLLLLVGTMHPIFLIPLTLVKETGGWIGVGVLLFQGRFIEAIVYGGASALIYCLIRIKTGKSRTRLSNAAPFITYPYIWSVIKKQPAIVLRDLAAVIPLLLLYFSGMPMLFVWVAIPIILFALPWESHLWFPLLIISIGVF